MHRSDRRPLPNQERVPPRRNSQGPATRQDMTWGRSRTTSAQFPKARPTERSELCVGCGRPSQRRRNQKQQHHLGTGYSICG